MYFGEKAVLLAMVQRGIISRILPYIKRATVYKVVLVYHLHCKLILIFRLHEYLQPFFPFFQPKEDTFASMSYSLFKLCLYLWEEGPCGCGFSSYKMKAKCEVARQRSLQKESWSGLSEPGNKYIRDPVCDFSIWLQ